MDIETWQNGAGDMPSCCPPSNNCTFPSYNNLVVTMGRSWKINQDHSKWGVSTSSSKKVTCVGDINRQTGQRKRGGGAVCTTDSGVWGSFAAAVTSTQPCT